ncbi:MAG TPA: hypothetical protein VGM13_03185 [Thermoanaerobaculia bacterium]|jgi:hypothetical protein
MPLSDLPLEGSRVLVALGLAVFIGVPLARFFGRMTRGEEEKEKEKKKIFLEGEEGEGSAVALGRARFVAAGSLLVGVLLEVQVMGSSLGTRHVWRAAAIFLLVASLVSSVMVVLPRERYYREKSLTFEENLRQPWVSRADAARRRASRIDLFGFLLALAALVLG